MLGNKRKQTNFKNKNKTNFKTKSYDTKKNSYKKKDEEILSESENDLNNSKIEKDEFFENDNEENNEDSNLKESADSKRLRLARKLISNIEGKLHNEDGDLDDKHVDDYLREEMQKENNEYQTQLYDKINPYHEIFLKGHLGSITSVDISSDSKTVISASKDCRAIKWDLNTNKKFVLPQFSKKPLLSACFAPDDKNAFFAGSDRHIYQVDIHNEKVIQSFKAHNDAVTGIIFDPNQEQYYSISNDKKLNVWGVSPAQKSILLETFYGHINKINDFDILGTNKVISCGTDNLLNLWKIDSQSFLKFQSNDSFSSIIDNVKGLNNTTFVTGGFDGTVTIWRTNKKKAQNKINNAHGFIKEFTPFHDFFRQEDQFLGYNNEIVENNNIKEDIVNTVKIPYPICSLATIKNSDLIFSGSLNGKLNVYRCHAGNKIDLIKDINVSNGCVNAIKVDKTNQFMVVGYGKDTRNGRWFTDNKAKLGISIVKLFKE